MFNWIHWCLRSSGLRSVGLVIALGLFPALSAQALAMPRAVFISPSVPGNEFWEPTTIFMQHAAENLGIELKVIYSDVDHLKIIEETEVLCSQADKPHYLVLVNHRDATPIAIREANSCGINVVLFNGAFSPKVAAELRYGPAALKHWIGSVLPDEAQSGYLVAKALVERARALNLYAEDGKIHLFGVNGTLRSFTTIQREAGLNQYVDEHEDLELEQVVPAFWSRDTARNITTRLFKRYPAASVIWTASDSMAIGVTEALVDVGKQPGKDVLTAGIDWIREAHDLVDRGVLLGSVGGHVFDGAWVMVKILDHHGGYEPDFFEVNTAFTFASKETLGCVRVLLKSELWGDLDFRRYSQFYGNKPPDVFGVDLVLSQLGKC